MQSNDVIVVVPTYNEVDNLEAIVQAVTVHGYRLLVVDDNSPDGTGELANKIASEDRQVSVLHRSSKEGLGPAYGAGFKEAATLDARITCEMDADFSHDPADLPRLVAAISAGADVSIGSRYVEGGSVPDWSWTRKMLSRGGNRYARMLLGLHVQDSTAGFRAFRTDALTALEAHTCEASGYGFQIEMTYRATREGYQIVEVPVVFRDRTVGDSKMSPLIVFEALWLVTRWGGQRIAHRS